MEHNQNTYIFKMDGNVMFRRQMSITASVYKKKKVFTKKELYWPLSRGYFDSWGRTLVAFAVAERWPL